MSAEATLFVDLDGTLTCAELLPAVADAAGIAAEMERLTEAAMAGHVPFEESLRSRVAMLRDVPLSLVHDVLAAIPVREELPDLLREHPDRSMVVTGNLDVWVAPFLARHGLRGAASTAEVAGGAVIGVREVLDKAAVVAQHGSSPSIAVGDGANDAGLLGAADVRVAWCGQRPAVPALLAVASHAFAREETLCRFLRQWW